MTEPMGERGRQGTAPLGGTDFEMVRAILENHHVYHHFRAGETPRHDDAACEVDDAFPALDRIERVVEDIAQVQSRTLAMLRHAGFVFDTPLQKADEDRSPAERWEKLAFTLYSTICEIAVKVHEARGSSE